MSLSRSGLAARLEDLEHVARAQEGAQRVSRVLEHVARAHEGARRVSRVLVPNVALEIDEEHVVPRLVATRAGVEPVPHLTLAVGKKELRHTITRRRSRSALSYR